MCTRSKIEIRQQRAAATRRHSILSEGPAQAEVLPVSVRISLIARASAVPSLALTPLLRRRRRTRREMLYGHTAHSGEKSWKDVRAEHKLHYSLSTFVSQKRVHVKQITHLLASGQWPLSLRRRLGLVGGGCLRDISQLGHRTVCGAMGHGPWAVRRLCCNQSILNKS